MSPRQFSNKLEGWKDREQFIQRRAWERARYSTRAIVAVMSGEKDTNKINKHFTLPWDDESKPGKKKLAYSDNAEELQKMEADALRSAKKIK